ncbi:heavy-metal-associated domain-containing protein [Nanoarchaeota archaeon]
MKKIKLKIKGMHCHACEMLVGDALQDTGVANSKIDSKAGTGEIEFDETKTTEAEIKTAIKKEGYSVE